jgi:hypothetical protein
LQCRIDELFETVHGLSVRTDPNDLSRVSLIQGSGLEFRNPEDKWLKLTIPMFDIEDVLGWSSCVEHYFDLKGVTKQEKIQAAMVAMEGKSLIRYWWWEFCSPDGFCRTVPHTVCTISWTS